MCVSLGWSVQANEFGEGPACMDLVDVKVLPCQVLLILHVDDFKGPRYSSYARYPSSPVKEGCNKFVDRSFHVELKV